MLETIQLDFCRRCYDSREWVHYIPEEIKIRYVRHDRAAAYHGEPCAACQKPLTHRDR